MKTRLAAIALAAAAVLMLSAFAAAQDAPSGPYRIQPEDQLEIKVWPLDDFSLNVTVRPDGKISYMMTGEIEVKGMTVDELTKKITESLVPYLNNPKVAVNIKNFKTMRAFVLGNVMKPGVFSIRQNTNVVELITMAEGPKKEAKLSTVAVIRKPKPELIAKVAAGEKIDFEKNIEFINVANLLGKGEFPSDESYFIGDGDIVYVPSGHKVDWNKLFMTATSIYTMFNIDNVIR